MYSDNPITNELVLICINDGDGNQCGYTYQERCDVAKLLNYAHFQQTVKAYSDFLRMVRAARRWLLDNGTALTAEEQSAVGRTQIELAATAELTQYYLDQLKGD